MRRRLNAVNCEQRSKELDPVFPSEISSPPWPPAAGGERSLESGHWWPGGGGRVVGLGAGFSQSKPAPSSLLPFLLPPSSFFYSFSPPFHSFIQPPEHLLRAGAGNGQHKCPSCPDRADSLKSDQHLLFCDCLW